MMFHPAMLTGRARSRFDQLLLLLCIVRGDPYCIGVRLRYTRDHRLTAQ